MNAQIINLEALTETVTKNVKDAQAALEQRTKILAAAKAAHDRKVIQDKQLDMAKDIMNQQVSLIQKGYAKTLKDARDANEKKYQEDLKAAGVDKPESYNLDEMIMLVDTKAITPALAAVGQGAKVVTNIGLGIFNRVKSGFNK